MPTEVIINNLEGQSPFYIYLCDNPVSSCVYIGTASSAPYSFGIPDIFNGQTSFNLKITNDSGCEIFQTLNL